MLDTEHKEPLEDGAVLLYSRNGTFYARVYAENRRYIHKSLKTRELADARKLALRFLHEIEYKKAEQLPLQQKSFNDVIDEYVKLRQSQYEASLVAGRRLGRGEHTSEYMLRQIKRVSKFWREYCGKMAVDRIDNAVLQSYIPWRREYYKIMPAAQRPRNAKLYPAPQTLKWETTLGKTLLRFAHDRGYRGKAQLPTWTFRVERNIVRPAFTASEFATIYKELITLANYARGSFTDATFPGHYNKNNVRKLVNVWLLCDYVGFLAYSGVRVGEANNITMNDLREFQDEKGRTNFEIRVRGKTGERTIVPRTVASRAISWTIERNKKLKKLGWLAERGFRKETKQADWLFRMADGKKIITLTDQFHAHLKRVGVEANSSGERYTLYSLRHFYAVRMLGKGLPVFDIARNMGTSVDIIERYYGKSATPPTLATRLGD